MKAFNGCATRMVLLHYTRLDYTLLDYAMLYYIYSAIL